MTTCVVCKKREGKPYSFYFGNDLSKKIEGTQTELVCDRCINETKTAEIIRRGIFFITACGVIALVFFLFRSFIFVNPKQYADQAIIVHILVPGLFLFSGIALIAFLSDLFKAIALKRQQIGEGLALSADRPTLEKEYAQIWTTVRYQKEMKKK